MSLMADKSPAPAPSPQQVPQAWHYNMNMYNMNMYQNPYMYNPAYGAHNYYQYYGQRMPNWGNFRGYAPGGQLQPWGMPPQPQPQQQLPPGLEQQAQIQPEQAQQPAEDMMMLTTNNNNNQDYQLHDFQNSSFCSSPWLLNEPGEPSTELPPLPPGPPPGTPAPPGTQAPPPRPPFHQFSTLDENKKSRSQSRFVDSTLHVDDVFCYNKVDYSLGSTNCIILDPSWETNNMVSRIEENIASPSSATNTSGGGVGVGPIRFNVNAQRPRPQLSQANPLGARAGQTTTSSKRKNKKKKKQQQQQLQQQLQQQQLQQQQQRDMTEDDEPETPPLPASPPPPPPPPPPPACAPPPPQQPVGSPVPVPQHPPGIKHIDDWPPSLRDYVNRCYAKCVLQVDMDRVGVILKGKILRATSDGTLWTKNWGEEPLPLLDSDSKPAGGLTLGMNLKDKLNKITARLGPPQKNHEQPQQRNSLEQNTSHKRPSYRPSFKRKCSSDSSSSSSSDSEDNSSSNNKRSRDKRSSQSWNNKRHSSKKSSEKAHLYKEYGSIGGGVGGPIKKEVLDKRAARFSCDNTNRNKNGLTTSSTSPPLYVLDAKPNSQYMGPSIASTINSTNDGTVIGNNTGIHDWEEDLHIVGTSTDIEKQYLRLTSAPDASQVRPPQVLARALSMVKEKWAKEADYHYTCEQLKSIRQDLTVQGIRDEFTIEVYETHARIALEKGDHAEFNQCQSQLCQLHNSSSKNRGEFVAYRILYYIFTNEFLDLSTLVNSLSEEDKVDECIGHGLKMAKAWTTGLHSRLFKLYLTAPRMSPYLIDWFLSRERLKALKVLIKAYRPVVPVDLLMKELAFGSVGDTLEFVDKFGLIFTDSSRTMIDCKSSTPILAAV